MLFVLLLPLAHLGVVWTNITHLFDKYNLISLISITITTSTSSGSLDKYVHLNLNLARRLGTTQKSLQFHFFKK